jgi:hypothetical protein
MPNVKLYHAHFTTKHPSETFPAEAQAELEALEAKKASEAAAAEAPAAAPAPKKAPKKKDELDSLLSEGLSKPKKK